MSVKARALAPAPDHRAKLADYDNAYRTFDWKSVEARFTWQRTGRVNMAHEAIDRHVLEGRGDRPALVHAGGGAARTFTFADLARGSNRFANVLAGLGAGRGDRVFVFMPRVPEMLIGILGALKLGAIPVPVSDAFMVDAVRVRLQDSEAAVVLTHADLLDRVPEDGPPSLRHVVVVGAGDGAGGRLRSFEAEMAQASDAFDTVWLGREDPLILHYTSGSTGRPKGALQAQAAMLGHYQTGRWVLDLDETDTAWCTAHPGRVTGSSYGMFAPWLNGAASVLFGGPFDAGAWYAALATAGVTVWHAAPSAFRMLRAAGDEAAAKHDLSSLRHVLSTGEPLDADMQHWGVRVLGRRIHDAWLMTETGHHLIANHPGLEIRLGSMGKPIPGIEAAILDEHGHRVPPNTLGLLCVKTGWPGMVREVWNDPARTQEYFRFPGWYLSGDTAMRDEDGYFWFQGRADEVIQVDGDSIGPFEVESALATHPAVADAGVIGSPDPPHGEHIDAFIVLRAGFEPSATLKREIAEHVRLHFAAHASPRAIAFVEALPRGATGKIERRALRELTRRRGAGA